MTPLLRMGSRRRRLWLGLGLASLLAALAVGSRAAQEVRPQGFAGRVEVKQVEAGYRPGDDFLRVRVHLVSGLAVEYETRDREDMVRILDMTKVMATGRGRMFVELESSAIKAFQISVP